ncbi:serine/threonine-protein kinase [Cecembia sp.]|uniref:serine/threonine-protein kinase n=1 Tax=Cecembia sp. TaxID=1898110 RepID=UPI0025C4C15F|nr:serine/threonine-protein kinase [Cecembia sp.]
MRAVNGNWEKLEELFHELTQLSEDKRNSRLATISKEDADLFEQLNALLKADKTSHPLFQAESSSIFSLLASDQELLGSRLGAFELKEVVGQGAMGTVFKGHRADGHFDQVVAIKLMKPLLINPTFRDYFERERQILAKLNHPNIARLYDGGFTDDGRPFFTMEWVSGKNLIDYCKDNNLGLYERLNLFGQVCLAVRYAHQSLIAHLDLKPQNIIINDEGQVKLLDFGVSRMVEEGFEKESGFTLAYAAPEQIERNNPSTVSDIYALGVILFELLNGYHPYEKLFKDPQGLKSAILKGNATSFKLSEMFGKIRFSNDLELICQKAMEVLPQHRYASVDELDRDLYDFRKDYPITAHAKAWTYQAQKYLRRNRTVLAVANSAFFILLAMGLYYTFQLQQQRNIAQAEAKRANQITNLITDIFSAADPNIGGADTITAVQLLDEGLRNLEKNLGEDPEILASMLTKISPIYLSLGKYEKGKSIAEQAYQINSKLFSYPHPLLAENELLIGDVYFFYGKLDSAEYFSKKGLSQLLETNTNDEMKLANAMLGIGNIVYELGRYEEADSINRIIYAIHQKHLTAPHILLANDLHMFGSNRRKMQEYDDAEKYLLASLEMKKELFEEPHLELALSYNHIGSLYQNKGDVEASIPYIRKSLEQRDAILGENHVETMASVSNLARAYYQLGRFEEALPLYISSFSVVSDLFGEEHYYYSATANTLGMTYFNLGNIQEAKIYLSKSVEVNKKLFPETDRRNATSMMNLAKVFASEGNHLNAVELYQKAYKIFKETEKNDLQLISQCQQALGECSLALGNYSTAIEYLEMALLNNQSFDNISQETISKINVSLEKAYLAMNN